MRQRRKVTALLRLSRLRFALKICPLHKMRYLLILPVLGMLLSCNESNKDFYSVAHSIDPASRTLEVGYNKYTKRAFLKDVEIETGIITLLDGDTVKYWFQSHHLRDDSGLTLFRLSDGSEKVLRGWFCCEVQLPEEGFANKEALLSFIEKKDGVGP